MLSKLGFVKGDLFFFEMMLNSFWRAPNTRQNQDLDWKDFSDRISHFFFGMFGTSAND